MPNSYIDQAYVQGLYCGFITFKSDVNMFERIEISESIYEGVVEPSYKKPNSADTNRAGHNRKMIGEATSLNN